MLKTARFKTSTYFCPQKTMKAVKTSLIAVLLVSAISLFAQTREIYTNPNFSTLAKEHKVLAILPFKATVKLRPKQMESMSKEQLDEMEKNEGLAIQSALESYFLKRKDQHEFSVSFQNTATTNAVLAKNNIDETNIAKFTPQELADLLEVDGVITGTLDTNKPMSEGASLALGLIVGFYGSTNSGKCTINIFDKTTGELLWKYEKTLSRSLGSDTNSVINAMMRKASQQFPYIQK